MAIIWITHDLGVVAGIAERVAVMYAGFIVELADVKDLYGDPRHPYTLGLLKSIPRLDMGRKQKLTPIDGMPPDLLAGPVSCAFAPLCQYVIDKCWKENPPLETAGRGHTVACWVDVKKA